MKEQIIEIRRFFDEQKVLDELLMIFKEKGLTITEALGLLEIAKSILVEQTKEVE